MSFKPSTNAKPALAQPLYVQADALKGRGSAWAIKHRFSKDLREQFDDGWGSLQQEAEVEHLPPATQIIEERAKTIVSTNPSPDIGFVLWDGSEHSIEVLGFLRRGGSLDLKPFFSHSRTERE